MNKMEIKTKITNIIQNWKESENREITVSEMSLNLYMIGFAFISIAIYLSIDVLWPTDTIPEIVLMAITGLILLYFARKKR